MYVIELMTVYIALICQVYDIIVQMITHLSAGALRCYGRSCHRHSDGSI